jgi:DNA-binding MarR family transcriptional regulator
MQPHTETAQHIHQLSLIRRWEDAHLPIYGSLLGRDLVLLLAQYHLEARRFTLKEIYFSLPYSENAVRRHLKRLLQDGWLSLGPPGPDRRFRFVIPSEKMTRAFESYLGEAKVVL